jgi:type I restriction enzyme S subunit
MNMNEWKKYKLGEILNLFGGGTPKTTVPEYWNGNIPWLSVVDFSNVNKKVYKTEKTITDKGLNGSSTRVLKKGQIIISARGTVGELAVLGTDMAFNQSCYGIDANEKTTNEFLYYLLKYCIDRIKKNTHGAVFDTITRQTFDNIEITIPALPTQTRIAQILTSLDDKIELLQQMNQTLETMAQAIFKEWFVDFKFPGFDGEMVDGVPKGWRKGKLGEEFDLVMGQSPKGETYNQDGNGMVFYQGRTDFGFRFPTNRLFTTEPNRKANTLDTLVSVRAPVGDINMANELCCIGRGLSSVRHKTKAFSYTYYLMKSIENIFKGFESEGTVFGSINKSNFENIEIFIPELKLFQEFEMIVNPIDYKILENHHQIRTLTHLRDTLLPRLMSGKIEIKKGEK